MNALLSLLFTLVGLGLLGWAAFTVSKYLPELAQVPFRVIAGCAWLAVFTYVLVGGYRFPLPLH
jgi:hypothetical protein